MARRGKKRLRMIHQLKIQSARIQVYDQMKRHQHWKRHGDLQKEVQKLLLHGNDEQDDEENDVNHLGHRQGKPGHGVRDRLKEIIHLIGLSIGISR